MNRRRTLLAAAGIALTLSMTGCAATGQTVAGYAEDCPDLAAQATAMFSEDGELLKVREAKTTEDNRSSFELPASGEVTRLSCTGMGVWGDGSDSSPVLLTETVDADGDQFVAWEEL